MHDLDQPGGHGDISYPRIEALENEELGHVKGHEHTEAEHHRTLDRYHAIHDAEFKRRVDHATVINEIEGESLQALRHLRKELDAEQIAAENIAAVVLSGICLECRRGITTVVDIYTAMAQPKAGAAKPDGVQVATTGADKLLAILKVLGMTD